MSLQIWALSGSNMSHVIHTIGTDSPVFRGDQEEIGAWAASGLGGAAFMCLVLYPQLMSLFSHHSILLDEGTGGSTMVKSTDLHMPKFFFWTVCGGDGGDTDSSNRRTQLKCICLQGMCKSHFGRICNVLRERKQKETAKGRRKGIWVKRCWSVRRSC